MAGRGPAGGHPPARPGPASAPEAVQEPRDEDVADFLCVASGKGVLHGL